MTLTVHIRDDDLQCDMTISDYDDVAYDPDSHSIQLYSPTGTASGAAEVGPTRNSLGNFSQIFTIPADAKPGNWRIRWKTVITGLNHSDDVYFEVKP